MNIDPRTLAARLGSAVFERIAKDGLLNREVIEDAIYREWLVFAEDQKSAMQDKATQRIKAWLNTGPDTKLGEELVNRSPARTVADIDLAEASASLPQGIEWQQPAVQQLALAQHCAAAWMRAAAINSKVTWNGLTETTRKGWLSVAELILSRRAPGISVWAEDIRAAYYKGCGADMIHAWTDITQHSKFEWNAVVEALNPFLDNRHGTNGQ